MSVVTIFFTSGTKDGLPVFLDSIARIPHEVEKKHDGPWAVRFFRNAKYPRETAGRGVRMKS